MSAAITRQTIPDTWWAALPSRALPSRASPFGAQRPRTVRRLGEDVVLWRDATGAVRAAAAACPHRGADLGLGRVVDGALECPYHGFRFAPDGACTRVPCEGPDAKIPPRLRLRTRRVVERHGFIWLASGAPADDEVPWLDGCPEPAGAAYREMTWDVPLARVIEGMVDIHHFSFAHRRWSSQSLVRLDPYEARMDDDGVLRSVATLRKEGAQRGFVFKIDVAFPGVVHLSFSERLHGVVVCTPIDDDTTWIGVRYRFEVPLVGRLLSELSVLLEMTLIQPDDLRMLRSCRPRHAAPEDGQYVHADKAAALWHARRKQAMHAAPHGARPRALPIVEPHAAPALSPPGS